MENMKKDNPRIGIYCRVSTREQAIEGFSIDNQKRKDTDYIDLYELKPSHIEYYVDEGYSARTLNRPDIQRMIQDVKDKKLDIIIIYKLDRLTRSVVDIYELLKLFLDNECNLVAFIDHLDIQSANGRLLVGILAIIAQWESESISERVTDALVQMCEEGKFPFGYTPFGTTKKDNKLFIDKLTHEILQYMYKKSVSGTTAVELSNLIFENFGFKMNDKAVKRTLSKPYNTGKFVFKGKAYYDVVPKLIDQKTFDLSMKTMRKRTPAIKNYNFYFGNSVRCSCGEICSCRTTTKKTHRIYYYYCERCNRRINQKMLLKDTLYSIFDHAKKIDYTVEQKKLINKIERLNKKIKRTYNQFACDKISDKVYAVTTMQLEDEKENLQNQLKVLKIKDFEVWENMSDKSRYNFIHRNVEYLICDTELKIVNELRMI